MRTQRVSTAGELAQHEFGLMLYCRANMLHHRQLDREAARKLVEGRESMPGNRFAQLLVCSRCGFRGAEIYRRSPGGQTASYVKLSR